MRISSQYKEMAGTLSLRSGRPPVVKSDGQEYELMSTLAPEDIPQFKDRTAVILKGIAGMVSFPGQPVQYLFWPLESTVRGQRFVFPDPTALHWQWLTSLSPFGPEGTQAPKEHDLPALSDAPTELLSTK